MAASLSDHQHQPASSSDPCEHATSPPLTTADEPPPPLQHPTTDPEPSPRNSHGDPVASPSRSERSRSPRKKDRATSSSSSITTPAAGAGTGTGVGAANQHDRRAAAAGGQHDGHPRSVSPKKTARWEQEAQRPEEVVGRERRRRGEEETNHKHDRETGEVHPEPSKGTNERWRGDKGQTQKDAVSHNSESGTLSRKPHRDRDANTEKERNRQGGREQDGERRERERKGRERDREKESREAKARAAAEEDSRREARGSNSNLAPDTLSREKKAQITPGPWKVPSSSRIHSQVEGL